MLLNTQNLYYRIKPDTGQLEEEEKDIANLRANREEIKKELESKEKGDE